MLTLSRHHRYRARTGQVDQLPPRPSSGSGRGTSTRRYQQLHVHRVEPYLQLTAGVLGVAEIIKKW
jgi:hypothetical protein